MIPKNIRPSMEDNINEDIIISGSNLKALINKFLPSPISAPVNSATIAPITASVALIFNPAIILGMESGKYTQRILVHVSAL